MSMNNFDKIQFSPFLPENLLKGHRQIDSDQMPHNVPCDHGGAPVAQWVKRWPNDLADRV